MHKFIITAQGEFKYGDVRLHKHLLGSHDICIGGGFYEFDCIGHRLLLSGQSYDFGPPRWHYIDTLKMPQELQGLTPYYEDEELSRLVQISYLP